VKQEQASTECSAKANVGRANVPYNPEGDYGRGLVQKDVAMSAFQGCIAEKGLKVTWEKVETTISVVKPNPISETN
jgi:hypothetical protein